MTDIRSTKIFDQIENMSLIDSGELSYSSLNAPYNFSEAKYSQILNIAYNHIDKKSAEFDIRFEEVDIILGDYMINWEESAVLSTSPLALRFLLLINNSTNSLIFVISSISGLFGKYQISVYFSDKNVTVKNREKSVSLNTFLTFAILSIS